MSNASPQLEPSDLWVALTKRERPTRTAPFPTPGKAIAGSTLGEVALRVLTESELHSVRANAEKAAREFVGADAKAGALGYEDIYRNEAAFQIVCLACRNVAKTSEPAFLHPKLARGVLTTDEIAQLLTAYNAFRIESGPLQGELTRDECAAWHDVLRKDPSRVALARLTPEALADLVLYLVESRQGEAGPDAPEVPPATGADLVDPSEVARGQ